MLNEEILVVDNEVQPPIETIEKSDLIKEISEYTKELYERNNHTNTEIAELIQSLSTKIENKFDVQLMGSLIAQLVQLSINNDKELGNLLKTKVGILQKTTSSKSEEIPIEESTNNMKNALSSMTPEQSKRLLENYAKNEKSLNNIKSKIEEI